MATKRKLPSSFTQRITPAPATRSRSNSAASSMSRTLSERYDSESPPGTPRPSAPVPSILDFSTPQPFVIIHVGSDHEPFHIHKNIITHYSPFFDKAFNGKFIEGKSQSMKFEAKDVDFAIFGFFVNWLYTQKIQDAHGQPLKLINLARLYMLFERFLVTGMSSKLLKDIEDSEYDQECGENTLGNFQEFAYTDGDDELKDITVNKTLEGMTDEDNDEMIETMPANMLKDFTKALILRCQYLERKSKKQTLKERKAKKLETVKSSSTKPQSSVVHDSYNDDDVSVRGFTVVAVDTDSDSDRPGE